MAGCTSMGKGPRVKEHPSTEQRGSVVLSLGEGRERKEGRKKENQILFDNEGHNTKELR